MTTLGELVTATQNIVNDQLLVETALDHANSVSRVNASDIIRYLNFAVQRIAAGVIAPGFNVPTEPLPDLYVVGAISTDIGDHVALPDNYGRCVQFVMNADNAELKIYENLIALIRRYPGDNAGSVAGVAIKGRNLYYRRVPSTSETLTIHYYRKPVNMSVDTDEPDGIPDHLHESLLCNFAIIEIAKRMHNMDAGIISLYNNLFYQAVSDLNSLLQTDIDHESFLR